MIYPSRQPQRLAKPSHQYWVLADLLDAAVHAADHAPNAYQPTLFGYIRDDRPDDDLHFYGYRRRLTVAAAVQDNAVAD